MQITSTTSAYVAKKRRKDPVWSRCLCATTAEVEQAKDTLREERRASGSIPARRRMTKKKALRLQQVHVQNNKIFPFECVHVRFSFALHILCEPVRSYHVGIFGV